MLAHYMNDDTWTNELINGDVHWVNVLAFGLAKQGTTRDKHNKDHDELRDTAKTLIYAMLYGAGSAKLGATLGKGEHAGAKLKNSFLRATPALERLKEKVDKHAGRGYLPAIDGRKIEVRSKHSALNSLLQSAGAIVMKKAIVLFSEQAKAQSWPVKIVAMVHDEIQIETTPEVAEDVGKAAVQAIVQAGEHFKLRCALNGEYGIGNNWAETH